MARRIVRTSVQLVSIVIFTFLVVAFLDRNYRVLPNVIHGYMPQHHPGHVVTDVAITKCSSLNPFSSCKLDPSIWQRIEKDLYLGKTWTTSAFVHIKKKHEEELDAEDSVVMDVSVGRLEPAQGESTDKWESRENGLWIRRSAKKKASDSDDAITDVDVLYGDDATEARENWAITGTPLLLSGGLSHSVHLTVRRGPAAEVKKPVPRIPDNGRLKIMQIADLHLSTGVGACRDAVPDSYQGGKCEADPRTLDFVTKILDEEKPDLVILSGDQVNGETAPDAQSAFFKVAALLIKRKIPYAAIFGNHDDEGSMSRQGQMAIMEGLPYSLSRAGPTDVDGVGNYYVEVLARGSSDHSALSIYMLDSHAYTPDERNFPGYDWIKPNQIEWFRKTAESRKKKHNEYTHRHMDIAFIHIPLPEYTDKNNPRKGEWREGVTAPRFNSGFRDALVEQGIVMLSVGHDHANDYCALSQESHPAGNGEDQAGATMTPALWMCYGGGVGFGGYGGYNQYHRRVRLFEVDTNEARIKTWKRLEYGDIEMRVDEQIIVDGGKAVNLPEKRRRKR
ncbi:phosphatase DCR2 [Sarocladium strictum]